MPSRLSSLLVRDGLVGVKRMEKAFQRQVIYGGSLDTILLEMGLVPEERLTQYLALASGLPPAARDDGAVIHPDATAVITRELAEQYRAVPIAFERDAIRVLVCAPLELTELEDLADLLDRPLQPLIAPEFRWHLVFAAAYNLDPPARFTTLARAVAVDPTPAPVGRAPTIIVDEPGAAVVEAPLAEPAPRSRAPSVADAAARLAPVAPSAETMRVVTSAPPAPVAPAGDEVSRPRRHTIMGVLPNRAATDGAVQARSSEDDATPPSGMSARRKGSGPSKPPPGAGPPTDRT
ncbi:MAG TPA: hypothetical protein VFP84_19410, partial [Kofleriaceae bacterium]|nr:hypothetical protein [Kofleriaceae bacterium]